MKLIPLTQGQSAKVDDDNFEWLNQWKWQATKEKDRPVFYAVRTQNNRPGHETIRMHRLVLGVTDMRIKCDHRNGDTLDNQRGNLRRATTPQNAFNSLKSRRNTSGFRGVSFHKRSNKWQALIQINGTRKFLGHFDSAREAGDAYRTAAKEYHGEFLHHDLI